MTRFTWLEARSIWTSFGPSLTTRSVFGAAGSRTQTEPSAVSSLGVPPAGQAAVRERRSHSSRPDVAEARLAQRRERVLLDPAAPVSGLGVAHDLTRVAEPLQIAGDDLVERCSLRAGDLDDAVSRRGERHIGDELSASSRSASPS